MSLETNDYRYIHMQRLNRYGMDYKSRVQGQREHEFELYLNKSIYRINFIYDNEEIHGTLERYKQSESEVLQYLLVGVTHKFDIGTILELPDMEGDLHPWLVYYLEDTVAKGYNRYVVLKMSHNITWNYNGEEYSTWGYLCGPGSGAVRDFTESGNTGSVYKTDGSKYMLIMPVSKYMKKDQYFEVDDYNDQDLIAAYTVTATDINTAKGIEFVTVDPALIRASTEEIPRPEGEQTDDNSGEDNFFWLNGG